MSTENQTAAQAGVLPDEVLADLQSLISDMHEGPGVPASAEILLDLTNDVAHRGDDVADDDDSDTDVDDAPDSGASLDSVAASIDDALSRVGVEADGDDAEVEVDEALALVVTAPEGEPSTGELDRAARAALDLAEPIDGVPLDARWGESRAAFGSEVPSRSRISRGLTQMSRWLAINWAFVVAGIFVLVGLLLLFAVISS